MKRYPLLYQINTRVRMSELATQLGRPATLDDISDSELDQLSADGFDLVWFLGVWQTGGVGRDISLSVPVLIEEYKRTLPDYTDNDVCGSCFAVKDYHVHTDFGGDAALARLRKRMNARGLGLILDFVPNHIAHDHRWVKEHPDYIVHGTEAQRATNPQNYTSTVPILAFGRDPYFDGWTDTLQLNYGNPELQSALLNELKRVSTQCDGVRCDMAMLVLPEVFEKTWGITTQPFWSKATADVKGMNPDFIFMAEVYWDLEWTMMQQGFDYAYDKRLYDRLERAATRPANQVIGFKDQASSNWDQVYVHPIREHFNAAPEYMDRLVHFLENHDEPRAAHTFGDDAHKAAAMITFFAPGLRFIHQGQREGKRIRVPVHLHRGPVQSENVGMWKFYNELLMLLKEPPFSHGEWQQLLVNQAWDGNQSHNALIAFAWTWQGAHTIIVVNFSPHQSQGVVQLPWRNQPTRELYRDMKAWGYEVMGI